MIIQRSVHRHASLLNLSPDVLRHDLVASRAYKAYTLGRYQTNITEEPEFCLRTLVAPLPALTTAFSTILGEQLLRRAGRLDYGQVAHVKCMRVNEESREPEVSIYKCCPFLRGANATTSHVITATVQALIGRPGARVAMRSIAGLDKEGLRLSSRANYFLRHVVDDIPPSRSRVHQGEVIAVWIGSANRDKRVLADLFLFDVSRQYKQHLAFGYRVHYCVGAPLARLTLRVSLERDICGVRADQKSRPRRSARV